MEAEAPSWLARLKGQAEARWSTDPAEANVLEWIRTIAREDEVVRVDRGDKSELRRLSFPSRSGDRGAAISATEGAEGVRFVLRYRGSGTPALPAAFQAVVRTRSFDLFERDTFGNDDRPLRLGLTEDEARHALTHARRAALSWVREQREIPRTIDKGPFPRLSQRVAVGVALWTRGELRGSMVTTPTPALRAIALAARLACRDSRFPALTEDDLAETNIQVTFIHRPTVPLSSREVAGNHAYADKALWVAHDLRAGVYLPEIHNIAPEPKLERLVRRLGEEKAGLAASDKGAEVFVSEVTEVIEGGDRSRVVWLDGPVARALPDGRGRLRTVGVMGCAWLAQLQNDDGALPLSVHPKNGKTGKVDPIRMAATADALAAFSIAFEHPPARGTAERALSWLDRADHGLPDEPEPQLLLHCYRGKAALKLGDEGGARLAADAVLALLDRKVHGPLPLAHALGLFTQLGTSRAAEVAHGLETRFRSALASGEELSLAEWAELAAAFPVDAPIARDVRAWLLRHQLASGAFASTTRSDFVYSSGTGKILEVLALAEDSRESADRALAWLLSMQYRDDSVFFVPEAHRPRVTGGLRYDLFRHEAWIDSVAHFLIGLVRIAER